ncbi:MAG: hypothetical protein CTY19_17895 [Methylomonas sp.]|nr:MAG: hypothetical protein CTY19_17895 [Methylomonas sp.]
MTVLAIASELTEGNLMAEIDGSDEFIFLTPLHRAEIGCAAHLNRLNQGDAPWGVIDADTAIPWVEEQTGMSLSQSQAAAVRLVLQHKVSVITGGPGVGKTTLVNSLLKILKAKRVRIGLCASTGRAAKRLTESTGMEAKTVHRLLEFDPMQFAFKHNDENPLDLDCLVIDESSMMYRVTSRHYRNCKFAISFPKADIHYWSKRIGIGGWASFMGSSKKPSKWDYHNLSMSRDL